MSKQYRAGFVLDAEWSDNEGRYSDVTKMSGTMIMEIRSGNGSRKKGHSQSKKDSDNSICGDSFFTSKQKVTTEIRSGEGESPHFRTGRYYCISGEWFFSTRENLHIGPFDDRLDAEIELMFFLRHLGEGGIYTDIYQSGNTQFRL